MRISDISSKRSSKSSRKKATKKNEKLKGRTISF